MIRRFLIMLGLVLLYMGVWALLILPAALWARATDDPRAIAVMLGFMLAIIIGFVPFLDIAVKRVFHFQGSGVPVSQQELRARIERINGLDIPVMVQSQRGKLVVTWRYVDTKWWELLAKAGLTQMYELQIRLNNAKKEALLVDVLKSVAWRAGPTSVRLGAGLFRGVAVGHEIGAQWGIKEEFELGKIYEYRFSPQTIKNPVMNTILRSGWDVRFGIW